MTVVNVILFVLKALAHVLGWAVGVQTPGATLPQGGLPIPVPKPLDTRARDKAEALKTENKILREAAEHDTATRVDALKKDLETHDAKGNPTGLDFSRYRPPR